MFDTEGNFLIHGREWGQHKYIRKEGNRYIYPEDLQKSGGNGMPSNVSGQQRKPISGADKARMVQGPGLSVAWEAKIRGADYARRQQSQGSVAAEKNKIKKGFENARKEEQRKRIANTTSGEDYARRQKSQGSAVAANNALQKAIDQLNRMNGHGKPKKPNAEITGQQAARRAANQGIASQKKITEKKQFQEALKTSGKGIAEMESRRGKKNESRASSQRTTAARDAAKEAQRNRVNNTTSGSDYARRQKEAGEKNAKDIKRKIGYGTQAAKSKAEKAYNVGKNTTERILTRLKTTDIPNAKKNYNKATDAAAEGLLKATNAHKKFTDNAADVLLDIEKKFKKKKR